MLAGPNGCGKSTVLFSLACAYKVPGAGPKDYVPSTLFPDFRRVAGDFPQDLRIETCLEYAYLVGHDRLSMRWRRGKSWNRSFFGRKHAKQPE